VTSQEPPAPSPEADRPGGIPRPAGIFDPVARALDLIGERWTLVLVRQLSSGPKGFQELRQRTGITPRVLSARLRQLVARGFVRTVAERGRSVYAVTERGHSLEPILSALARWYVHYAVKDLELDTERFTETSAQSILEALPWLLREERARGATLTFEIRLSGTGGGVWTVRIEDGACHVEPGFADRADVRYTADARVWCGVALGFLDARDAIRRGLMTKDGARAALDHYFHQVVTPKAAAPAAADADASTPPERSRP
jgi:DNA-binding HxlR family transcriptional regulator